MPNDSTRTTRLTADRLVLAAVLLFTLVVRGGVLWALRNNLADDPDAYRQIAENLLRHGVFAMGAGDNPQPTAYRPPLYPIVLSNLPASGGQQVSLAKVAALHLLLGVATVWLTWLTARRYLASGPRELASCGREPPEVSHAPTPRGSAAAAALTHPTLAALLVACDPLLLHQQSLVMTETLATFLAVLAMWCLTKFSDCRSWSWDRALFCPTTWFWAGLSGGAIGLAVLCRPTFLPWLALVAFAVPIIPSGTKTGLSISDLPLAQKARRTSIGWRLLTVVALFAGAGLVLSPWIIRNQRIFGTPMAGTTHGGYTLLLGNNHRFYKWLTDDNTGLPWNSAEFEVDIVVNEIPLESTDAQQSPQANELMSDQRLYHQAIRTIQNNPILAMRACLYRITQLWSPLPHKLTADESLGRRWQRYATCVWYCGVFVLAAVGVWRLRWQLVRPPWVWGLLLCVAFTAVHTFYWSNLRMRAPLMPFVALVAAAAVLPRERQSGGAATL